MSTNPKVNYLNMLRADIAKYRTIVAYDSSRLLTEQLATYAIATFFDIFIEGQGGLPPDKETVTIECPVGEKLYILICTAARPDKPGLPFRYYIAENETTNLLQIPMLEYYDIVESIVIFQAQKITTSHNGV